MKMQPGTESLSAMFNLFFVLRGMKFRRLSAEFGMHLGQPPILNYIWKHEGCTQKEIADVMMISPATVAVTTKRMQKAGLLEKQTDENNLRCNFLRLTPQGENVAQRFNLELEAFESRVLEGVLPEDKQAAERVMRQIIDNFRNREGIMPECPNLERKGKPIC